MWLHLWAPMESWLMTVDHVGRHARSWSYIQESICNHEKEWKAKNLAWILYSVYAVLGVCCTRCMLYSVYAVLGVCCTRCMLYSVYAVLGVCCTRCMLFSVYAGLGVCCSRCMLFSVYAVLGVYSWSWHGEMKRDDLTLCSWDDGRVMDEKEGDGWWRWEWCGGYEWIHEMRGTTCLICLGRPRISVITRQIGTCTCHPGDGKLTPTRNSPSLSLACRIPPSLLISLSRPHLYNHLRRQS